MTKDFKSQLSEKESAQRIIETRVPGAEPENLTDSVSSSTNIDAVKTSTDVEKSEQEHSESTLSDPDKTEPQRHSKSSPSDPDRPEPQHLTSPFPDVQVVPDESTRLRQAMHTLLEIKNFKLIIAAGLTVMFVILGQYAIGHQSLQSPFSTVKASETPDGYLDQAAVAYFKGDYGSASDAWKLAIDKSISQNIAPLKLGELYESIADKVTNLSFAHGQNHTSEQQKGLGQLYYSRALNIYQKNKISVRELGVRYKIAALNSEVDGLDKEANLRAIIALDETGRKIKSERIGRIYSELGRVLEEKGDTRDAELYLQKAICESNPNANSYSYSFPFDTGDVTTLTRLLLAEHHYKDLLGLREYLVASKLHQSAGDTSIVTDLDKLAEAYTLTGNATGAKNAEKHAAFLRSRYGIEQPTQFYRKGFEIKGN
jgi:hypothetical protein